MRPKSLSGGILPCQVSKRAHTPLAHVFMIYPDCEGVLDAVTQLDYAP